MTAYYVAGVGALESLAVTSKGGGTTTFYQFAKASPFDNAEMIGIPFKAKRQKANVKGDESFGVEIETMDYEKARLFEKGEFCSSVVATFTAIKSSDASMAGDGKKLVVTYTNLQQMNDIGGDADHGGMPCKLKFESAVDIETGTAATISKSWA